MNFLYCYLQEANHTSCPNIQYQLVKEFNGDMSNKPVKHRHTRLGRSKSQPTRRKPTEQKVNERCSPWLPHLTPFHSNSPFQLFCPFCPPGQASQQTRAGSAGCRGASRRCARAEPWCRAIAEWRCCGRNLTGTGGEVPEWLSCSPTEARAWGCAEVLPGRPPQQASSTAYGKRGKNRKDQQSWVSVLRTGTPALHCLHYVLFVTLVLGRFTD